MRSSHQLDIAESREKDKSGNEENSRVRSTHFLETALGEIDQDTERKRPSDGYSQTRHEKGRDKSGRGKKKKATETRHSLTGDDRGGQGRTWKDT